MAELRESISILKTERYLKDKTEEKDRVKEEEEEEEE